VSSALALVSTHQQPNRDEAHGPVGQWCRVCSVADVAGVRHHPSTSGKGFLRRVPAASTLAQWHSQGMKVACLPKPHAQQTKARHDVIAADTLTIRGRVAGPALAL